MALSRTRVQWIVGEAMVIGSIAWRLRREAYEVDVASAALGPLGVTLEEKGDKRIRYHVEVAAPVSGRVEESRLTVGDSLRRGDVLVRVRPAPLDPRSQ